MFTTHLIQSSGAKRRTLAGSLAAALSGAAVLLAFGPAPGATAAGTGYGWPVKPFDQPHPVRGSFGDPRTVFKAPPTPEGMMTGNGSFAFHFGVDISAPDGSKVYPVVSGRVSRVKGEWVAVDTGNGRSFQYWHIRAAVRLGQSVQAGETVLGTILSGAKHVHFSELENGQAVNPLRPGHLSPYQDSTTPDVESISFRATETGANLMPNFVRGRLIMVAEAYDTPELRVPGAWGGMPVAPALVTWRIQKLTGKVVVRERITADFRTTIPAKSEFWSHYARGTYQNMSVFGKHYSYRQPGCFLFKLMETPFDTRSIPDGNYDLVVTVTDIRGNTSSKSRRLTVHNKPGWVGP